MVKCGTDLVLTHLGTGKRTRMILRIQAILECDDGPNPRYRSCNHFALIFLLCLLSSSRVFEIILRPGHGSCSSSSSFEISGIKSLPLIANSPYQLFSLPTTVISRSNEVGNYATDSTSAFGFVYMHARNVSSFPDIAALPFSAMQHRRYALSAGEYYVVFILPRASSIFWES